MSTIATPTSATQTRKEGRRKVRKMEGRKEGGKMGGRQGWEGDKEEGGIRKEFKFDARHILSRYERREGGGEGGGGPENLFDTVTFLLFFPCESRKTASAPPPLLSRFRLLSALKKNRGKL
jgi:hypothetical protein